MASLGIDPDEIEGEDGEPNEAFVKARLLQMRLQRDASERQN